MSTQNQQNNSNSLNDEVIDKKNHQRRSTKPQSRKSGKGRGNQRSQGRTCDARETFRNDPRWYYVDPKVAESSLRMNFEQFVGRRYLLGKDSSFEPVNVLTYFCNPTPNRSAPLDSNKGQYHDPGALWAARKLYSALSSVTGRTSNYTPNTLTFLILALGELLSMYSFIRRIFGYYRTYNRRNWGVPDSILIAMGVDVDDFVSNCANYRTEFDKIVTDMNDLSILSEVTYFQKCVSMYDNVYADMNADMAQLFLLVPASTWYLREDGSSVYPGVSGTVLESVDVCMVGGEGGFATRKMSEYLAIIRQQLRYLMESSTLTIVYSDIINYIQKNGGSLLLIPRVGEEYGVSVIYNASVSNQMHHAMQMGHYWAVSSQPNQNGLITETLRSTDGTSKSVTFTPRNDIIELPTKDSYSYMPLTWLPITKPKAMPDVTEDYWDPAVLQALMYDAESMDETLDQRLDNTRYMVIRDEIFLPATIAEDASSFALFNLTSTGDHAVVSMGMVQPTNSAGFLGRSTVPMVFTPDTMELLARFNAICLPPLQWAFAYADDKMLLAGPIGDLRNTTFLDANMLRSANQLIERALFDVRNLKGFGRT